MNGRSCCNEIWWLKFTIIKVKERFFLSVKKFRRLFRFFSVQSPASADADNFIFARLANKHELVGGRTKCQNSESVKSFKTRRIADPVTGLPVTNRAEC